MNRGPERKTIFLNDGLRPVYLEYAETVASFNVIRLQNKSLNRLFNAYESNAILQMSGDHF